MKSTREGYGQGLLKLGQKSNVYALSADLTTSTNVHHFAEKYPQRFVQCGVAEQNMVSMAAGLALENKIPFASTFGVFMIRALDQIRMSVCYNNLNVKLVATHCGLMTGEDGTTHQALEDVAMLRALPNLTIIEPCDYNQALEATLAIAKHQGPVYLRLHRGKSSFVTEQKFEIGKGQIIQKGEKLTVVCSGPVINQVLKATEKLDYVPEIINMPTIKPLDDKLLKQSYKKTGKVLVVQDHHIIGGLGSAVQEVLPNVTVFGVDDKFTESGQPEELWDKYGLSVKRIYDFMRKV
jgi:transketolase